MLVVPEENKIACSACAIAQGGTASGKTLYHRIEVNNLSFALVTKVSVFPCGDDVVDLLYF